MSKPKLALIPSGYKSGTVYSILPNDASGDFDFDRASEGTRVRKDGLIEEVTNDVPRLDWLNSDCPSLKLEPQRTNLQIRSEEFDNSAWTKLNVSVSANDTISPNGTNTADAIVENTGTGGKIIYDTSATSVGVYTFSVHIKKEDKRYTAIQVSGSTTTSMFNVDLDNGTGEVVAGSFDETNIETLANDWYRVSVTFTTTSGTLNNQIYLMNGSAYADRNYTGNGTDKNYVWGAQLEQGSYPTSYIKTEASTVTRLKDECLNGGDSDLFDITEGTFFVDAVNFGTPLNSYSMITLSDGSNNFVRFLYESSRIRATVYNGAIQSDYFITGTSDNQRNKVAITFKENEFKTYLNGVLKDTDTSGVVPTGFDRVNFSNPDGTSRHFEGKVYDTRVYDRVLTEAEAIELTT